MVLLKIPITSLFVAANESTFSIVVAYRQTAFREITQIKAYGINSLVGNMGGYMGLLLGYAVLNFPDLLRGIFNWAKGKDLEDKPRRKISAYMKQDM